MARGNERNEWLKILQYSPNSNSHHVIPIRAYTPSIRSVRSMDFDTASIASGSSSFFDMDSVSVMSRDNDHKSDIHSIISAPHTDIEALVNIIFFL